ncbi:sigma-54 interaction domain-containing protein [Undibacterium sp. Xuan67W]|uniref:sigma-54 interaction domain-containing protein n=1 Tax=Undibacterium sp. Xuan67W TaxID=3413057 RepID=UPI003BF22F26
MDDLPRYNLIGSSATFQQTCRQIEKIASVDATILIAGETGTGKELAARAIHYQSGRSCKPFIPINCGALPEALIESELFGHDRGAFTDAKLASPGLVSEADGGSMFLDEVDALSLKAQAAILRFLQDKTYRRVGSGIQRYADVRFIVASNANLEQLVETRQFRRDLLYRINVLMLRMPPLRDREGDALELANNFLIRFSHQYRLPAKTLHRSAREFLDNYSWPGNIRELENVIHREFLMSEGTEIHLDQSIKQTGNEVVDVSFKTAKASAISTFEKNYVHDLLDQTDGNLSRAARIAGQDRSAFGKLARKYGIHSTGVEHIRGPEEINTK